MKKTNLQHLQHFNKSVPVKTQHKIHQLARLIAINELSNNANIEALTESRIDEISGVSYSGYIALQEGGFKPYVFADFGLSSGKFYSKEHEKFAMNLQQQCSDDFCKDNNITEIDFDNDDLMSRLCEYESDYFEDYACILSVEIYIEHNDNVRINYCAKYRDAPYFRNKYAEVLKSYKMNISSFMKVSNDKLADRFHF